jgi:hypothetical protein
MVDMVIDREARAVAEKIVRLAIRPEDQRLIGQGLDSATVGEILVNGAIIALVGVFRDMKVGGDEELVEVLRGCAHGFDGFAEHKHKTHTTAAKL